MRLPLRHGTYQNSLQSLFALRGDGLNFIIINKSIVHDAPVVGIEGTHLHGLATVLGLRCQLPRGRNELFLLPDPKMIAVNPDTGRILHFLLQNPINKILQIIETISMLTDQESTLLGKDLQAGPFLTLFLLNRHLNNHLWCSLL